MLLWQPSPTSRLRKRFLDSRSKGCNDLAILPSDGLTHLVSDDRFRLGREMGIAVRAHDGVRVPPGKMLARTLILGQFVSNNSLHPLLHCRPSPTVIRQEIVIEDCRINVDPASLNAEMSTFLQLWVPSGSRVPAALSGLERKWLPRGVDGLWS
jgi:hypothetical protein